MCGSQKRPLCLSPLDKLGALGPISSTTATAIATTTTVTLNSSTDASSCISPTASRDEGSPDPRVALSNSPLGEMARKFDDNEDKPPAPQRPAEKKQRWRQGDPIPESACREIGQRLRRVSAEFEEATNPSLQVIVRRFISALLRYMSGKLSTFNF